ncbi:DUF6801 domain-containing protein [Streptomyces sp. NPDC051940]|uniref:DUF6801 domain-containing protein n=1 Tax=Streptomyces sp. NPDC051940 TaxID=3155675 RepID=UPI00341CE858
MALARTRPGTCGWSRRAIVRAAPVGAAFLLVGAIPGTVAAAADHGERTWTVSLPYECTLPSGTYDAHVAVTATLPRTVSPGEQIKPTDVALDVSLPAYVLTGGDGTAPDSAAVASGTAELDVAMTQEGAAGKPTIAPWRNLAIPETQLPSKGDAVFGARGDVPWVSSGSRGDLTLTVGEVRLVLGVRASGADAENTSETAETAEADTETDVRCALAPDTQATLAVVSVGPSTSAKGEVGSPPDQPRVSGETAPDDVQPNAAPPFEDPGKGCTVLRVIEPGPKPLAHGYLAGYANAAKLGSAVFLQEPAHLVDIDLLTRFEVLLCNGKVATRYYARGRISDEQGRSQFPPARATMLTYGFMPTTATVELIVDGPVNITAYPLLVAGVQHETVISDAKVWIRISDVKVNGVKLDVGPNCRTVRPMDQRLVGKGGVDGATHQSFGYTVTNGGPLTGWADIPPFSGCGVHEDLDNVFTSALSGPDNFTKLTQAPLCATEPTSPNNRYCPDPPRPDPQR